MDILIQNKYEFIFALIRISVILTFGIFFGDKRIPNIIKIALIFLITVIVSPTLNLGIKGDLKTFDFTIIILSEFLLGLIIGIISATVINIMEMAGSLIDIQGGFGMAQVFNPATQSQTSIVAQFLTAFGLLFFILNDYHITFLEIIIRTFDIIPVGSLLVNGGLFSLIPKAIEILVASITTSLFIALPVVGLIFMIDIILGISTRSMPQLNLFSVGYIVKICSTMIFLYVYSYSLNYFIKMTSETMFNFLERLV